MIIVLQTKRRKEVKYLADGRKEINGDLQEKKVCSKCKFKA